MMMHTITIFCINSRHVVTHCQYKYEYQWTTSNTMPYIACTYNEWHGCIFISHACMSSWQISSAWSPLHNDMQRCRNCRLHPIRDTSSGCHHKMFTSSKRIHWSSGISEIASIWAVNICGCIGYAICIHWLYSSEIRQLNFRFGNFFWGNVWEYHTYQGCPSFKIGPQYVVSGGEARLDVSKIVGSGSAVEGLTSPISINISRECKMI